MKKLAPIALFVYNRLEHLQQTILSLQKNNLAKETTLYIFSDAGKNSKDDKKVEEVRKYLKTIRGFKSVIIIERLENFGLAKSIIEGVSELINKYGKIIVLEDDLYVSGDFIKYMNEALDFYQDNKDIFSISGYCAPIKIPVDYRYDVFLFERINSWGWASWKNRWETVDWEMKYFEEFIKNPEQRKLFKRGGKDLCIMLLKQYQRKINSWAIRFNYACFEQKKLNVYPVGTKVINLGADGSGTNIKSTKKYKAILNEEAIVFPEKLTVNKTLTENYCRFFEPSIFRQTINYFKLRLFLFRKKLAE